MEIEGKGVKALYTKFKNPNELPKDLPADCSDTDKENHMLKVNKYWKWFDDSVSSNKATEVIENVAGGDRILWIDYRFAIDSEGRTGHIHCSPKGKYDTGVFAYNLVQRGARQGIRVVGTVRRGCSINALAIYER